ncbi:MAG: hypothetical protein A3E80_01965 [Chlamydiae bacterium RIFCSPHIGHO2_12_FULL_49_9]|nr:MAG: hypothetical protein A3E80_01965 [Chlamydiae bacterium RIFCSPHIGHO2_12_FULL_49_9]
MIGSIFVFFNAAVDEDDEAAISSGRCFLFPAEAEDEEEAGCAGGASSISGRGRRFQAKKSLGEPAGEDGQAIENSFCLCHLVKMH